MTKTKQILIYFSIFLNCYSFIPFNLYAFHIYILLRNPSHKKIQKGTPQMNKGNNTAKTLKIPIGKTLKKNKPHKTRMIKSIPTLVK